MIESLPLSVEFRVRSYELDSLGHVNNAVYMNYFEHARIRFFAELGFALREYFVSGNVMVLAESQVKFRRPAFMDDLIRVDTVLRIEKVRMIFDQTIRRGEEVIATGMNTIVALDARGRPCLPPDELIRRIQETR